MCWNNKCATHLCSTGNMCALYAGCHFLLALASRLLQLTVSVFNCDHIVNHYTKYAIQHHPLASASVSCVTSPHWFICSHTMCKLTLQFYSQYKPTWCGLQKCKQDSVFNGCIGLVYDEICCLCSLGSHVRSVIQWHHRAMLKLVLQVQTSRKKKLAQ